MQKDVPKIKTLNVSNKNYEQTYCILKSSWDSASPTLSVHHDVLFRFGSWCYSGKEPKIFLPHTSLAHPLPLSSPSHSLTSLGQVGSS